MAMVGFNLSRILVERKDVFSGKIEIKSKAEITNIKKEEIELAKGKETLKVDFDFAILYEPGFAKIEFKGHVLVMEEPKKAKDLLALWKKKKVDPELQQQVFNIVLRKCNIKAFQLEEDLNLPTHLPMPSVSREQEGQGQ